MDWANIEEYKHSEKKTMSIEPLGEDIKTDWVEYKFDDLEKFYQYFQNLTKEEVDASS